MQVSTGASKRIGEGDRGGRTGCGRGEGGHGAGGGGVERRMKLSDNCLKLMSHDVYRYLYTI